MKGGSLHWIRIGFLFGIGMALAGVVIWPLLFVGVVAAHAVLLTLLFAIPILLVIPVLGFLGRGVGYLYGQWVLRRGWAERARRIT